jgi:hypothetical protein
MEEQQPNNISLPQATIEEASSRRRSLLSIFFGRKRWAIYSILVIVLILLGIIWLAFQRVGSSGQPDVKIWFDVGETVRAGRETQFSIVLENHDRVDLKNMSLEVVYPEGFRFVKSSPSSRDDQGRSFSLPDLVVGGSQKVEISGIFSGSPQEVKTVRGRLFYQLSNATTVFNAIQIGQVVLEAPDFNLRVNAPTEVINGQIIDYLISFENISDQELSRVQVRANFPGGFVYTSSSLPPAETNVWPIGLLKVGQAAELRISGTLTGTVGDDKILEVDLGYLADDNNFVMQSHTSFSSRIKNAPIDLQQSLPVTKEFVNEGETLNYLINFQNVGVQGMHNIRLIFKIESPVVDLTKVRLEGGALVNKEFIWTAAGVPKLALLQPDDSGSVNVTVPIRDNLIGLGVKSPVVKTYVYFTSDEFPLRVPGPELIFPVQSKLFTTMSATHESGPMPPQPGQTSVYRIDATISNSVNDVSGAVWQATVSTPLVNLVENSITPQDVADKVSSSSSSGRLTWRINDFAAFESKQISFKVSITPSTSTEGSSWVLVKNIELSGKDTVTTETLSAKVDDVRTVPY